jgi:hypothetical protein
MGSLACEMGSVRLGFGLEKRRFLKSFLMKKDVLIRDLR